MQKTVTEYRMHTTVLFDQSNTKNNNTIFHKRRNESGIYQRAKSCVLYQVVLTIFRK